MFRTMLENCDCPRISQKLSSLNLSGFCLECLQGANRAKDTAEEKARAKLKAMLSLANADLPQFLRDIGIDVAPVPAGTEKCPKHAYFLLLFGQALLMTIQLCSSMM